MHRCWPWTTVLRESGRCKGYETVRTMLLPKVECGIMFVGVTQLKAQRSVVQRFIAALQISKHNEWRNYRRRA